jgi:hypothetical protein
MKTKNLTTIAAIIVMMFLSVVYSFGQTVTPPTLTSTASPQNVGVNSTHAYDVEYTVRGATPNVYTWTVYTANSSYVIGAPATSGTQYTITAGANA